MDGCLDDGWMIWWWIVVCMMDGWLQIRSLLYMSHLRCWFLRWYVLLYLRQTFDGSVSLLSDSIMKKCCPRLNSVILQSSISPILSSKLNVVTQEQPFMKPDIIIIVNRPITQRCLVKCIVWSLRCEGPQQDCSSIWLQGQHVGVWSNARQEQEHPG